MTEGSVVPTSAKLADVTRLKNADALSTAWGPRLRRKFGYYNPDEWYEALLDGLVGPQTEWLDAGCGRTLFPSNVPVSRLLADRCKSLTGIDPSDNIDENPFVDQRAKTTLEGFDTDRKFDLITLRMVAEHIADPESAAEKLAGLARPGGYVVIYTVHRWSPVSVVASATPMWFHHWAKRVLWRGEERDNFPTTYLMNTRRTLSSLMQRHGFSETAFKILSDTRATARFKSLNTLELSVWKMLDTVGLNYPERCFMAVYQRT